MENSLGEFLEQLRKEMHLSLREAANRSGLSYTYIRDIERGYNRSTKSPIKPTPETLQRLAKAYNCSYDELMQIAGYLQPTGEQPSIDGVDPEVLKALAGMSVDKQRRVLEYLVEQSQPTSEASVTKERFLADMSRLTSEELKRRYKLEIEGEAASPEEIEEAIAFIKVKRMMKNES